MQSARPLDIFFNPKQKKGGHTQTSNKRNKPTIRRSGEADRTAVKQRRESENSE